MGIQTLPLHLMVLLAMSLTGLFRSCREARMPGESQSPAVQPSSLADSVLRVTATIQYPDLHRPWLKKQPFTRAGLGTVIAGGRLLVTADMVAHATYIELEKPEDGPKGTAVVEAIDEECNLAVIKPVDCALLKDTIPLAFDTRVKTGTKLEIMQLEQNGAPAMSPASVNTVAVMAYPGEGASYLAYRTAAVIPQREGSFVIPALHEGKLAGLVMRYDPKSQAADIIPAPLIERFLKESIKPGYRGLARAGLMWDEVRGSTLREWLGAGNEHEGVYVTWVQPGGPADKAGLRKGDLLLKADGKPIDGAGNYVDPVHGKITFYNLASLEHSPGDTMEITYFRSIGEGKGSTGTTSLQLAGSSLSSEISPSRLDEESSSFVFLGGLLFQELSRPYLLEWGADWKREAPQNLVYLDAYQKELPPDQGRFVILSAVFPSARTVGFDSLSKRVVKSINGREIHKLADVTEAAKHPEKGFQRIIVEGAVGPIYLEASTMASEEEEVRREYGITSPPKELR